MNDVKQVLRYSIPGWVFILVFFVFLFVTRAFIPPSLKNNFFNDFFFSLNISDKVESNSLLTAGGLLVSGIPLGFILSQIYYYFMSLTGNDMIKMFPDMFKSIIYEVKKNIKFKNPNTNNEIKDIHLNKNHNIYFGYLISYLRIKFGKDDENLMREQNLSDLAHSLGASYYSIIIAFIIYLTLLSIYNYRYFDLFSLIAAFSINLIISGFLIFVFYRNRRNIASQQIIIYYNLIFSKKEQREKENINQ
jgi:hypothetical protein